MTRQKAAFTPINSPQVGMYVCGPTVYGEPHLGHVRSAITYDIIVRYLKQVGYKVRYVRNVTDVGHLEDEFTESGEDKISKKARLEKIEPMEIVQYYTIRYHEAMHDLNCLTPNIEPRATGHILEQIELIEEIIKKGLAYVVNGSVYFDLLKYATFNSYGQLSGKILADLITGTRMTEGADEKKNPMDFALWKRAKAEHIMKWNSPWGQGFPGWHLECTAMSKKYLGSPFDIHGGGIDLQFPHHEAEIAQCQAAHGHGLANYWIHNNLLTINGQKMSKSLGNFITLNQFFKGEHELLSQAFSPMVIRFFILQTHYRSTLNFSSEALVSSEKGYKRLIGTIKTLNDLSTQPKPKPIDKSQEVKHLMECFYKHMSDDFNTPNAIANLFDLVAIINTLKDQADKLSISNEVLKELKLFFPLALTDVLGLKPEKNDDNHTLSKVMDLVIELRAQARNQKDFVTSDLIRDKLKEANVVLQDGKDETTFSIE